MKKFFRKMFGTGADRFLPAAFVPLTGGIPGSASGSDLSGPLLDFFTKNDLPGFFQAAFNLAFSAGAILAVLRLAYAGWLYMGAADMWGSKARAKEIITDTMLGLALLIGIWIVLNQINPCLLNLDVLQTIRGTSSSCETTVPANVTQIRPM